MQDYRKRKKICYIITKGTWGGAQKYVYNLATSLPEKEYDVLVISGEGGALQTKLKEKGVRVHTIPEMKRDLSLIAEIKSLITLWKVLKREAPDVLHLNSPKAGGLGAFVGRLLGIRNIIFTAHGWTHNEDRPVWNKTIVVFFSWLTVFLCHKTIVINDREWEEAEAMPFAHESHIYLIRNGLEEIHLKERDTARKEILSLAKGKVDHNVTWIGTLSELHPNKGLEYAIQGLSSVNFPFAFFIIGEGVDRKYLESLIERKNLKGKVFLLGFVNRGNQYLKAFDIYLQSSVKEGLPYAILEAGQAGLPVIATRTGGIPDIIEHGKNGILIRKAEPLEIEVAVEHLIENPGERKIYGAELKEKIKEEFSLEEMLDKTIRLYNL